MKRHICIAIAAMGFSGLVAEILLLRELLIVFSGNELCIGIITANWLILEALGSHFLGKQFEKSHHIPEIFALICILFSSSLFTSVFLARIVKNVTGISIGETIGFFSMLYSSMLILLPAGMLHGASFTLGCRLYALSSHQDASSAGKVYVYETVGTITGGIVCTYLFVSALNTFEAISWTALVNLTVCLVLLGPYWKRGLLTKITVAMLGCLILTAGYLIITKQADKLHRYSIKLQWKNQNVVHYQNSQYGNICVLENQGQYIYFQDGVPNIITPIPDLLFISEFVHIPLLTHPEPKNILILSRGAGGVIYEALKHPSIVAIEYTELDPLLIDLFRKFPTPLTNAELNDKSVKVRHIDGRLLVNTTQNTYDVILLGIMDPSNLQSNRFFTEEFYSVAKTRLNEGGILVLGVPGSLTYINEELKNLNSCIYLTLKSVFSYLRVIPGDGTHLFLVSDSREIQTIDTPQILERLNQRNIKSDAIVPWYIEKKMHPGWQDWFTSFLDGSRQKVNSDTRPVGLFYSIAHWNAIFAPSLRWLFELCEKINLKAVVLVLAGFVGTYFFIHSKNKNLSPAGIPLSILTTGFAGMIFNLMLIFAFQSIYGYVFSWIGLLVASFMAGAACGAALTTTFQSPDKGSCKLFIKIDLIIICFSLGFALVFSSIHQYLSISGIFSRMLFHLLSLTGGFLIGTQFPLANRIYSENHTSVSKTAGLLYACDLLGGWSGGIIGAVVLLPLLGLVGTSLTVGLVKLASFIILLTESHQHLAGG